MQEIIQKILRNEIMYYVVVPVSLPILGWIKNWHDIKVKNRTMGYWKIKYRRSESFYDIALKTYIRMMINIFVVGVIKTLASFWLEKRLTYIICGFICSIVNSVIVICVVKKPKTKIELYTDGRIKQLLLFMLDLIFSIGFWTSSFGKYQYIVSLTFGMSLFFLALLLVKCMDMVYILDKSCADIYVNGAETVKCVYAGSIRKNGNWIYVDRYIEDYYEEIRIKESEIVRIDYYGEPLIDVRKLSLRRN